MTLTTTYIYIYIKQQYLIIFSSAFPSMCLRIYHGICKFQELFRERSILSTYRKTVE